MDIPNGWEKYLNGVNDILDKVYISENIYPNYKNVLRCFKYFKPEDTKLVILGQDPYYNGTATGLAFHCKKNYISKSLLNIINEINDLFDIKLDYINLEDWAKQNILLLNCSLTVLPNKPNSHYDYWKDFSDNLIKNLSNDYPNIIFILWGKFAQKKIPLLNNKTEYICAGHPSPYSIKLFKNNFHFKYLEKLNIKWY